MARKWRRRMRVYLRTAPTINGEIRKVKLPLLTVAWGDSAESDIRAEFVEAYERSPDNPANVAAGKETARRRVRKKKVE